MNHDALFKMLLKNPSVLRAFFEQFLPEVAVFIDFSHLEYVDKERHTLSGKRRTGDLLVMTRFHGEAARFLIHLEHQAQPEWELGWRMLEYIVLDRRDYGMPVYPVAVLSHTEPAPSGSSPLVTDFPNKRVLLFDFDVIDLGRLQASDFVQLRNSAALALSSRMTIRSEQRIRIVRDFFVSLASTEADEKEKELVSGFFLAYQPLSAEEGLLLNKEFNKIQSESMREKIIQLTNPFIELGFRRGVAKGRTEGLQQGRREEGVEMVLRLLSRRVGAVTVAQKRTIRKLDLARIEALGDALLGFESRADLTRWLKRNAS